TITIDSVSPVQTTIQPVTIHATVRSTGAPLTGTVRFRNQSDGDRWQPQLKLLGAERCAGTSSVCTVSIVAPTLLPKPELNRIVASYEGDDVNAASESAPVPVSVDWATTTGSAQSVAGTTVYGQPVEITTMLSLVAPATPNFNDGWYGRRVPVAVDDVTGWRVSGPGGPNPASLAFEMLPAGAHRIAVTWGDASIFPTPVLVPAAPVYVDHLVKKASTETTLVADSVGSEVRLAAIVATVAPGRGNGTGEVTFTEGDRVLGRAPVAADGSARLTTSLPDGQHTIRAAYSGDGNYQASSSDERRVVTDDGAPADPVVLPAPKLLGARATTDGIVLTRLRCAKGLATLKARRDGRIYAQRSVRCTDRTMRIRLTPRPGAATRGKIRVSVRFTQGGRATTKVELPGRG
ncbi:MAG TPA: Ig-like domain-containing protein, partial [Capillimicrobium sp.]